MWLKLNLKQIGRKDVRMSWKNLIVKHVIQNWMVSFDGNWSYVSAIYNCENL